MQNAKSFQNAKICYTCKKNLKVKMLKINYIVIIQDNIEVLKSVPKESSIVFHNGSNYDYHFIIKKLAEEFEKQFTCLGDNTET